MNNYQICNGCGRIRYIINPNRMLCRSCENQQHTHCKVGGGFKPFKNENKKLTKKYRNDRKIDNSSRY